MILTPTSRIDHYVREGWWGKRRIHDWVQDNLHDRADQVALVDPPNRSGIVGGTPRRMTWRELSAEVDRLSDCLLANGLQRDDIALVQLPNCVELPLVYRGVNAKERRAKAIEAHSVVTTKYAESPKAPDAWLACAIASRLSCVERMGKPRSASLPPSSMICKTIPVHKHVPI